MHLDSPLLHLDSVHTFLNTTTTSSSQSRLACARSVIPKQKIPLTPSGEKKRNYVYLSRKKEYKLSVFVRTNAEKERENAWLRRE